MDVLKCNADPDKIYYVNIGGKLYQCRILKTKGRGNTLPMYVLDVAHMGEIEVLARNDHESFNLRYHKSTTPGVLYESVEAFKKNTPVMDSYGSTGNCYNSQFLEPLFKTCNVCRCGGLVTAWKWDGAKAVKVIVNLKEVEWTWDRSGFHCALNDAEGLHRTKEECEKANDIEVVEF